MSDKSERARFSEVLKAADKEVARFLELVRDFLRDYPDHPTAELELGCCLVTMARYDEAREVFMKFIRTAPKDKLQWAYAEMGHLYDAKGDYSRAANWYRKAIQQRPGYASFHVYLGGVLAQSGKLDEALDAHRRAIRCRTGCRDEAYLNLGYILRSKEQYTEARRCFKKALDIDPEYREAHDALADVEGAIALKKARE